MSRGADPTESAAVEKTQFTRMRLLRLFSENALTTSFAVSAKHDKIAAEKNFEVT